jgi:uroporphyrinogen III methyltransferase/synthase
MEEGRRMSARGKVYLVGAGPGDPLLITMRGWMALREADSVIYDRLASVELLREAKKGADLIEVGKKPGGPSCSQEEINLLLVERAMSGEKVVRLKNGDPFIFGRGFEEVLYLSKKGVDFEIIPGPSSATAVPACAGIPLTHRGLARSVAIITGHTMEGDGFPEHAWESLARGCDTLVILMGAGNLEKIADKLTEAGADPEKPAAAISWGATFREKVIIGSLGDLPRKLEAESPNAPVTLVIGDTVGLGDVIRRRLAEKLLREKTVLVPRKWDPEDGLTRLLVLEGAFVYNVPAIMVEEGSQSEIMEAFTGDVKYDLVIFTSKNSISHLFKHLWRCGFDARVLAGCLLCAIGPGTARALEDHGLRADLVPASFSTRGIQAALKNTSLEGARVLLARSNLSDQGLKGFLEKKGAEVREIHPYQVQLAAEIDHALVEALEKRKIDVILLTSPSTVSGLINLVGGKRELLRGLTVGCIGPVTARAARKAGIDVSFRASVYSNEGLVRALVDYLGR